MVRGKQNVINKPLVEREREIIFPPLHIKLGLMKQLGKALKRDRICFGYLSRKFPGFSTEKLKAGIFDGPQIQLIKDPHFTESMNEFESNASCSFVQVVQNFLGNHKVKNQVELVEEMLTNFNKLGCNIKSIKIHYLHSYSDSFPENLSDFGEEQEERFHQDIKTVEERYQGRWDIHMMVDYCWSLQRDSPGKPHARKSNKRKFFIDD